MMHKNGKTRWERRLCTRLFHTVGRDQRHHKQRHMFGERNDLILRGILDSSISSSTVVVIQQAPVSMSSSSHIILDQNFD